MRTLRYSDSERGREGLPGYETWLYQTPVQRSRDDGLPDLRSVGDLGHQTQCEPLTSAGELYHSHLESSTYNKSDD